MPEPQILSMEQVDALESTLTTFEDQRIINLIATARNFVDENKRLKAENASMRFRLADAEAGFLYMSVAVIDGTESGDRCSKHALSLANSMRAAYTPNVQS